MATIAQAPLKSAENEAFYFHIALVMAAFVVVGFSTQWLMGRSSFSARPLVHVHGVVLMGWIAIFTTQSWLAAHGPTGLHRRLGQLAAAWVVMVIVAGFAIIVDGIQRGKTPFFFQPQHFLIANPMSVLCFGAIVAAALRLRRHSDWHMRLQICATSAIMGPAFGRLLPMPLLIPYAWYAAFGCGLLFPLAGALRDLRRDGRVHPAWWWGMTAIVATAAMSSLIAFSPLGDAIYAGVTAGHPGAARPGLAFAPPPPM